MVVLNDSKIWIMDLKLLLLAQSSGSSVPPQLFSWGQRLSHHQERWHVFYIMTSRFKPAGTSLSIPFLPKNHLLGEEEMEMRVPLPDRARSLVRPSRFLMCTQLLCSFHPLLVWWQFVYQICNKVVLNIVKNPAKNWEKGRPMLWIYADLVNRSLYSSHQP